MKIGKYKLTNPKRFIIFILSLIFIVSYICLIFHTNKVCVEKVENNLQIQEEIKNKTLIKVSATEIEKEEKTKTNDK